MHDSAAISETRSRNGHALGLLLAALAALLVAALIKSAWVSEDAYITLRTIDNFWQGYGLRWNVLERVQTYTHPLWMLTLGAAYGVTRESAYTAIAVSLVCTIGVVWLMIRALTPARACLALALLVTSSAFVDFSTSGLENPLTHLLLAAFWLTWLRESPPGSARLLALTTIASLVGMTRLDLLVLVTPAVLLEAWRLPLRRALPTLALGAVPLIAWDFFALIYYGFHLPNTAYAKLATGVPAGALARQGLLYLRESLRTDPVTLLVIVLGILAACLPTRLPSPSSSGAPRGNLVRGLAFSLPMVLYLAYVVRVGGDYMNGRFLTPAFLCGVIAIATSRPMARPPVVAVAAAAAMAASLVAPYSALRLWEPAPPAYTRAGRDLVMNERLVNYAFTGLIPMLQGARPADQVWATQGRASAFRPRVIVHQNVGFLGYYGGPGAHMIDELGLGDPLLARLPAQPGWFAGHYQRPVPAWYRAFLERCLTRTFPGAAIRPTASTCFPYEAELDAAGGSGDDAAVVRLYRDLLLVTQGPIFDRARLWTIVRLNLRGSTLSRADASIAQSNASASR